MQLAAGKTYKLTSSLNVPNRTTLTGAGDSSVLDFALPDDAAKACHPSGRPVNPGRRCDNQGAGCDCLISGVYGSGSGWGLENMSVILSRSPAGAAAVSLPASSSNARLMGLSIELMQDHITNNAIFFQGERFELGHSTLTQTGKCWFAGPNSGGHKWGGTAKATIVSDGASEGWVHHVKINWNCGGWGIWDLTSRMVLEDNKIVCTEQNNQTNGVIEGGSGAPNWDGYRDKDSRFWSVARNSFSRPVGNGACLAPAQGVNCSEAGSNHTNWNQRETFTSDGPGEYAHGTISHQAGARVAVQWAGETGINRDPVPGTSFNVIAGPGMGQRRFVTAYDNATRTVTLDMPLDGYPDATSIVAVVTAVGEKIVAGNHFSWYVHHLANTNSLIW